MSVCLSVRRQWWSRNQIFFVSQVKHLTECIHFNGMCYECVQFIFIDQQRYFQFEMSKNSFWKWKLVEVVRKDPYCVLGILQE